MSFTVAEITLPGNALRETPVPFYDVRGATDGPTFAILAGVHGCEYTSQQAVREVLREIGGVPERLAGRVKAISTLSVDAFWRRSAFVSPTDQENPNRHFPGDHAGGYTDQLTAGAVEALIDGSDFFLDVHAGDQVEDLTPFTLRDDSGPADASGALARAYGFPLNVVEHGSRQTFAGMSISTATERGIPAVIVEAGRLGLIEPEYVLAHKRGLYSALRHAKVLSGPSIAAADVPVGESGYREFHAQPWQRAAVRGWWSTELSVGDTVHAGQHVGQLLSLSGEVLQDITAHADGVVLCLTRSPAVAENGLLFGIATDEHTPAAV